jgi:hypothetical protein
MSWYLRNPFTFVFSSAEKPNNLGTRFQNFFFTKVIFPIDTNLIEREQWCEEMR